MFKKFSQLGRAFMLPISILPVAGLLLGLGGALTNEAALKAYPWLNIEWLQVILKIMQVAGNAVFANLALIFAVGIAVGLSNADKGTAGLSGAVSFLVYTATIAGLLQLFSAKGATIDTGVVGSIVIGSMIAYMNNHYSKVELPQFLGFFGGSRFIPIITSFAAIIIGVFFYLIWPPIQGWLVVAGKAIAEMGSIGAFFYGFLLRLTGAVGLHHTIYPLFWYTSLGGTAEVAGHTIVGAQNIFFAQLADANHTGLFTYGTRFFAGRFATMMFGLPAAALAMYHSIPKRNRKKDGGLYLSGGLTSFLTGITEPLEYTFLFVAPWLYVIHAFLDGLSFFFADIMNIRIGNSFSGGLIDYLLFGVLQGQDKTNWPKVLLLGIIWAVIYYLVFRFCITKFHVAIPGMCDDDPDETVTTTKKTNLTDQALIIIDALGGSSNIESVEACATRLRVAVKDSTKVDKKILKDLGAAAVLEVSGGIQAVFGGKADLYSQEINQLLKNGTTLIKPTISQNSDADNQERVVVKPNSETLILAPVTGEYVPLSDVKDDVFSQKLMGDGFGIQPTDQTIYAPVSGKVVSIFKTKHAIGLQTVTGLEVLIHLGIDTVELAGQPFELFVSEGQEIIAGDKLATENIAMIKEAAKDPIVLTLITNSATTDSEIVEHLSSQAKVDANSLALIVK